MAGIQTFSFFGSIPAPTLKYQPAEKEKEGLPATV